MNLRFKRKKQWIFFLYLLVCVIICLRSSSGLSYYIQSVLVVLHLIAGIIPNASVTPVEEINKNAQNKSCNYKQCSRTRDRYLLVPTRVSCCLNVLTHRQDFTSHWNHDLFLKYLVDTLKMKRKVAHYKTFKEKHCCYLLIRTKVVECSGIITFTS